MSKITLQEFGVKSLKTVGKMIKSGCELAIPIVGWILMNKSDDIINHIRYSGDVCYNDAVEAIMKSNVYSGDKVEMVSLIKKDADTAYYRSVISIVKTNMYSGDKIEAIKGINGSAEED